MGGRGALLPKAAHAPARLLARGLGAVQTALQHTHGGDSGAAADLQRSERRRCLRQVAGHERLPRPARAPCPPPVSRCCSVLLGPRPGGHAIVRAARAQVMDGSPRAAAPFAGVSDFLRELVNPRRAEAPAAERASSPGRRLRVDVSPMAARVPSTSLLARTPQVRALRRQRRRRGGGQARAWGCPPHAAPDPTRARRDHSHAQVVVGLLLKYVNLGSGWRPRLFVLQDGVLRYYKARRRHHTTAPARRAKRPVARAARHGKLSWCPCARAGARTHRCQCVPAVGGVAATGRALPYRRRGAAAREPRPARARGRPALGALAWRSGGGRSCPQPKRWVPQAAAAAG